MKTFTIPAALLALATLGSASPAVQSRQYQAFVTFSGAGSDPPTYSLSIPTDGTPVPINNPLSVSHIFSYGGATCSFRGVDGSNTVIVGYGSADVGPPQTQVEASCFAF